MRRRPRADGSASRQLSPHDVDAKELAGEPIRAMLTTRPATAQPIGGLKVVTDNGWFAVRPSGTEDVYKFYAESFRRSRPLTRIQEEARSVVDAALAGHASSTASA